MTASEAMTDRQIDFDDILRRGKTSVSIVLSDEERRKVAETLDIPEVNAASGTFKLSSGIGEQVKLSGHISAELAQNCVTTLAPVNERISVKVERDFAKDVVEAEMPVEETLNPFENDPPDYVSGNEIDLLSVISEVIALEMSTYPKSEAALAKNEENAGVSCDLTEPDPSNPFAVLAHLKNHIR